MSRWQAAMAMVITVSQHSAFHIFRDAWQLSLALPKTYVINAAMLGLWSIFARYWRK
jgi:hypothetical protein